MVIPTTRGPLEEAGLIKTAGVAETDDSRIVTVEYCAPGCDGPAHHAGVPDARSHFCDRHIHRSVHVHLKQGVLGEGIAGGIG